MSQKERKVRVLFPIGAKLVIIISILVILSLGAVTFLVSYLSTQDVQRTAEDNNFTVNRRAGSQAEGSFKAVQTAVLLYLEMLEQSSSVTERDPQLEWFFFSRNQNLAAIQLEQVGAAYSAGQAEADSPDNPEAADQPEAADHVEAVRPPENKTVFIPNEQFFLANNISADMAENYFTSSFSAVSLQGLSADRMLLFNAAPAFEL
jgi:hypothetical protein